MASTKKAQQNDVTPDDPQTAQSEAHKAAVADQEAAAEAEAESDGVTFVVATEKQAEAFLSGDPEPDRSYKVAAHGGQTAVFISKA